jgi:hypothetical protein
MIPPLPESAEWSLRRLERMSFKGHWRDCACELCSDPRVPVDYALVPLEEAESHAGLLLP